MGLHGLFSIKFMKRILGAFIALVSVAHAVQITGFGSGDFTATAPFGSDSQSLTAYTISGSDNNSVYGDLSASVPALGSVSSLYLIGTLTFTTNPSSNFQIELFDSVGNGRIYQANWSSFTTSTVQQEVMLSFLSLDGAFNGTATAVQLLGAGSGTASINFSSSLK